MQALWILFGVEGLALLVVAFAFSRVAARFELELERHRSAIRRLWRDRDELRKEVNGLRHYVGEKLAAAGLAPATVQLSALPAIDVEPCARCGTLEGERVGNVCRECDRDLKEGRDHGTH